MANLIKGSFKKDVGVMKIVNAAMNNFNNSWDKRNHKIPPLTSDYCPKHISLLDQNKNNMHKVIIFTWLCLETVSSTTSLWTKKRKCLTAC